MRIYAQDFGSFVAALLVLMGCGSELDSGTAPVAASSQALGGTSISSCTAEQADALNADNARAAEIARAAYYAYLFNPASELAIRWFGDTANDPSANEHVAYVLYSIALHLDALPTKLRCTCQNEFEKDTYAYTVPDDSSYGIVLCDVLFWTKAKPYGILSQPGIIAHEISHWYGTKDNSGIQAGSMYVDESVVEEEAQQWALSLSPDAARDNAITYQFFIEENALQ